MAPHEILIAVIGVTGAGKTTFVSKVTGNTSLRMNDGVDSVTDKAVSVPCMIDGQSVTLIDTPGFDDSKRTEVDILKLISLHLMEKYMEGTMLNGVVFLQPINQPRVGAAELSRTRLFKKLLGEQAYERLVIGGTMWTNRNEAEGRIQKRKEKDEIWGDMIRGGATVLPYDNTKKGALDIVRHLMKFDPKQILIQKELAGGKKLEDTSAGRELDKQKGEEIAKLKNRLRDLESDKEATAAELRQLQDKIYQKEEEIMDLKRGC
ncbi:P-loop containing nucleoside triphosphate hydrolase protein [Cladorrhinum sp. PSN259]|nr:P-loop containing nucleoside triphosphate hydrolase protein [Cladorrhinum sp. PSN259]